MKQEPLLTTATLINQVVCDLLYQHKFGYAHFPEIVDLAVVSTGLGMLQSNIGFVNNSGSFWDSTQWGIFPRPFLDSHSLAYASAIAAWARGDKDPEWANELPSEVKNPMRKSLKYLIKTNDSFIQPMAPTPSKLDQSQDDWLQLASSKSASQQVVAIRQLDFEDQRDHQREALLLEKLQSGNRAIVLHSIAATERMKIVDEPIAEELRLLVQDRDDEIRAKAMCSLTRSGKLDESTVNVAVKMLDSNARFVVFAGVFALASLDSVPEQVMPLANRGFVRALQACDYEFVGLFTAAYNRWLDDPETHFEQLLQEDGPEYLEIALEALQNVRQQLVALG